MLQKQNKTNPKSHKRWSRLAVWLDSHDTAFPYDLSVTQCHECRMSRILETADSAFLVKRTVYLTLMLKLFTSPVPAGLKWGRDWAISTTEQF